MMYFILENFLYHFIAVGLTAFILFLLGLRFIVARLSSFKNKAESSSKNIITPASVASATDKVVPFNHAATLTITSQDINAIAGEDQFSTQLDLARAYFEAGRKQLAAKILTHVVKHGNPLQQKEAVRLLKLISSSCF